MTVRTVVVSDVLSVCLENWLNRNTSLPSNSRHSGEATMYAKSKPLV